jgi:hypothetical protein
MRFASGENISASLVSLTSLARRGKCDILSSLRVSQFVSLAFARLTNKQGLNSQREISVRLKFFARFSQDSRDKITVVMIFASLAMKFLIARLANLATKFVCKTREKLVFLRNFFLRGS